LEFVTAVGAVKTRMMPLLDCPKCDEMSCRLDTLGRQTDRQTDGFAITISRCAYIAC